MHSEISGQISELERKHDIRVLYAAESGSRAWGFESADSDWDVRFIYVHNRDWYLSIDAGKDSISTILPGDLDLSGWELSKTLILLRKSNPSLLEWLDSPIIYKRDEAFYKDLVSLSSIYFNPKACLYHYLNMADNNFRIYMTKDKVRVKKYFYVLRPLLACHWLERNNSFPPLDIDRLIAEELKEKEIIQIVEPLLKRKRDGDELGEADPDIKLIEFFSKEISRFRDFLKAYPSKEVHQTSEKLNQIFRKYIAY